MLSPGVVLNDRYLLNDRIATGGMGDVWSATDTLLKRRIAVKVLLPSLVSDTEFITRFRTEARLMAALRHPGIVQVYDYGEDAVVDGRRVDYLVMEYIEGVPLSKRIRASGRLGVTETLSVLAQVAQALHVAHNANIVHRDVKPNNLLVQPDGTVVLVDFGVARSAHVTSITGTNVVLGTVQYMAPEQIAGRPVSAATDIYALGAVAYCCLTGRPPFPGTNPLAVVTQHLQEAPPALPADIPAPVVALVIRALAKDPASRHPSAAAFADAAHAAQGAAPTPLPAGPWAASSGSVADTDTDAGAGATTAGLVQPTRPETRPVGPAASGDWRATVPPTGDDVRLAGSPATGAKRRRAVVLASVAGAVVVALAGVATFLALQPTKNDSAAGPATKAWVGASSSADPGPAAEATTAKPNQSGSAPGGMNRSGTNSPPADPASTGGTKPGPSQTKPAPNNPHTPGKVCGSGYQVIDSAALTGSDGVLRGRVYLLYNADNGDNCTVALKATSVGKASAVSTYLELKGRPRSTDSGSFDYYAGPVRVNASGVCVKWGGSAGGASYNSPFEHCD